MRVVAALFPDRQSADAARADLARELDLADGAIELAARGTASDPDGPDTVLAGRFRTKDLERVRAVIEARGGTIDIDVDEGRARM